MYANKFVLWCSADRQIAPHQHSPANVLSQCKRRDFAPSTAQILFYAFLMTDGP